MSAAYRIGLPAVDAATAAPRVREPLEGARKRMGMIPNMYGRMANSAGVHSVIADKVSKVAREVTDAIRAGVPIGDDRLRALSELARAMVATRGLPEVAVVKAFLDAGYSERQVLEVVLAVSVKTISNYVNHLFDTPVDAAFAVREWKAPPA